MINNRSFAFAGKATFTVVNEKTAGRHTLRVSKAAGDAIWFVSMKQKGGSFEFVGTIFGGNTTIKISRRSFWNQNSDSYKVAQWIMERLETYPAGVEFKHEGKCCRCGKSLTDPKSIDSGIGPYCAGLINQADPRFSPAQKINSLASFEVNHAIIMAGKVN